MRKRRAPTPAESRAERTAQREFERTPAARQITRRMGTALRSISSAQQRLGQLRDGYWKRFKRFRKRKQRMVKHARSR